MWSHIYRSIEADIAAKEKGGKGTSEQLSKGSRPGVLEDKAGAFAFGSSNPSNDWTPVYS